MEVFVILALGFIFSTSFFICLFLNYKFSKYRIRLTFIYLLIIFLGYGFLAIQYWQFKQLNTLTISLEDNTADFIFKPSSTGDYSVDLDFINKTIKQNYESCGFSWKETNAFDCSNALIFRTIDGVIDQQSFSASKHYHDWKPGDLDYGFNNYSTNGPSLRIFEFHGIKNTSINMHIHINATTEELQSTKAIIVVAPQSETAASISRMLFWFTVFCLPLFFSIANTLFKKILRKI